MSDAMAIILDHQRRCSLRAPVTELLDDIVMVPAVQRCILVAQALSLTIGSDSPHAEVLAGVGGDGVIAGLVESVRSNEVFDKLKREALSRRGSPDDFPSVVDFKPDNCRGKDRVRHD